MFLNHEYLLLQENGRLAVADVKMVGLLLDPAALSWASDGSFALSQTEIQLAFTSINALDCVTSHKLLRDGSEIFTFPTLDQFQYVDSDSLSPGSLYQYQLRVVTDSGSNVDSPVFTVCTGNSNCKVPHCWEKLGCCYFPPT